MGFTKSSTYCTHSTLPSFRFLCSTWNPVSSPRPTRVGGRRAQGLSRSAVALAWRHPPAFPGRALTAPAALPDGIDGHFGPQLRRFVLAQYHQGQMTVPRLVTLLRSLGILICKRQVIRLLIAGQDGFLAEA